MVWGLLLRCGGGGGGGGVVGGGGLVWGWGGGGGGGGGWGWGWGCRRGWCIIIIDTRDLRLVERVDGF